MDLGTFWDVIATAQTHGGPDVPFDRVLSRCLADRGRQDIIDFQKLFDELHASLWRCDLWAAAYLIGGGCSNDGFIDFRAGLIGQGRDWLEKVAADPDSLADHPAVAAEQPDSMFGWPLFYEEMGYAARRAFEIITGDGDAFDDALGPYPRFPEHDGQDPAGEDFDFDDDEQMRRRLPRLFDVCRARWH